MDKFNTKINEIKSQYHVLIYQLPTMVWNKLVVVSKSWDKFYIYLLNNSEEYIIFDKKSDRLLFFLKRRIRRYIDSSTNFIDG